MRKVFGLKLFFILCLSMTDRPSAIGGINPRRHGVAALAFTLAASSVSPSVPSPAERHCMLSDATNHHQEEKKLHTAHHHLSQSTHTHPVNTAERLRVGSPSSDQHHHRIHLLEGSNKVSNNDARDSIFIPTRNLAESLKK